MTSRFTDSVVVVTGGGSGIGAATSRRFAAEGATVVVADISADAAAAVVAEIEDSDGAALPVRCDVSSSTDWAVMAEQVQSRYGRLDVVHNNAAVATIKPAHELGNAEWEREIGVNLSSVYLSVRAFLPFLRRSRGCIVNTSSVHAMLGFLGRPAYAASKGGMVSLTRQLAVEYGPEVRVNAVLPGPILTPPWKTESDEYIDLAIRSTPAGRMGTPEEVAAAVCFLASSDASYISGATLLVDGGFTAQKDPA
jgi:glucose 1-dehydrogenase